MPVFTRFVPGFVVAAALLSSVGATGNNCKQNEFWYTKKSCCLPNGGNQSPPQPPSGSSCPGNWNWHNPSACCVPKFPQPPSPPAPNCSNNWKWHDGRQCCIPSSPPPSPPPTPVVPPPSNNCGKNEFWFDSKKCCLPHGGPPSSPPPPPPDNDCPTNGWYWHKGKSCCVPKFPLPPNPPTPPCKKDWEWKGGRGSCGPCDKPHKPIPSGHWKRSLVSRSTAPKCERGLTVCFNPESQEESCVDSATDFRNCGGCVAFGRGKDCSLEPLVKGQNVACIEGVCQSKLLF